MAAGFEHSVANMYFIPAGWLIKEPNRLVVRPSGLTKQRAREPGSPKLPSTNLAAATIGNVIGGAVLVGFVYWFVYLREPRS